MLLLFLPSKVAPALCTQRILFLQASFTTISRYLVQRYEKVWKEKAFKQKTIKKIQSCWLQLQLLQLKKQGYALL